jgi:hypothetical protein
VSALQTFLDSVKTTITAAFHKVEDAVGLALNDIWNVAHPIFTSFSPVLVRDTLNALVEFLGANEQHLVNGDFADVEQAFLMWLELEKQTLFSDVQSLGSTLLHVLIGLAKQKVQSVNG